MTILEGEYAPYFYDAAGDTLEQAYAGNVHNLSVLMDARYAGFAENARRGGGPVIAGEYQFPVLNHPLARGGVAPAPKYLKESITPVTAAVALGAAKQYGLPYWACLDLHCGGEYPGHTPRDLWSALLFAYWTGAERTYIENLGFDGTNPLYQGSLYVKGAQDLELSPWGEVAKEFRRSYLPAHRRGFSSRDFNPEIAIVRFPDSDWGQEKTGTWITGRLYGAPNLLPDAQTRYWIRIWHVLTHGRTSLNAVNYSNLSIGEPFRFFFPANNVAVYDHLASDPGLYQSVRLVFLTGKLISPECMDTLRALVREKGLVVVTPRRLAPEGMGHDGATSHTVFPEGDGQWIVTDDVMHEDVVALVAPYLGQPDELRYVFGDTEVVFTAPHPAEPIQAAVRTQVDEREESPMKDATVHIDAGEVTGRIKPLHGMGNGPVCLRGFHDFTSYYEELDVPYVRLHDVPFTWDNAQDIHYVFPDMGADPERPENYDFGQTDFYLQSMASLDVGLIYRLGYSIEFEKSPRVHDAPPASFSKWAAICAHIVRHYNQGWGGGEPTGIRYWEVWNEPDQKGFWRGAPEEFYELYDTTARAVKDADPSVKVGGPALAQHMDFLEGFLEYCEKRATPLDFVSWHIYATQAQEVVARAEQVRSLMERHGFADAESILDEWNYARVGVGREVMFTEQAGMPGATFDAATLIRLQDAAVDLATFYTGTNLVYGLFNAYGTPHKAYYAFLAFRRLLDTPQRLWQEETNCDGMAVLAGISPDRKMVRVLISNPETTSRGVHFTVSNLPWPGATLCEKQVLTAERDLEPAGEDVVERTDRTPCAFTEEIDAQSVYLLTLRSGELEGGV